MKFITLLRNTLAALGCLLMAQSGYAAGLLTPANGNLPALQIKSHHVEVTIADGYAITEVEQTFHNPHTQDLEAIYAFPVPKHGAVAEFTVWIDGQPVSGEVLERQQARQIYEEEKTAGRSAGLTEKNDYRTFDISVSPVRAGQDTRIRFVYLQPVRVDTGMGRYLYPLEEGGVDERKLAFWNANDVIEEQFSFKLTLKSAYPVEAVRMANPNHAQINQITPKQWQVELSNHSSLSKAGEAGEEGNAAPPTAPTAFTLDQDIVVYWRHQAGLPGSVDLLTHKPEGAQRGTFMLTVTPGDDLQPIKEGVDWIFILDISGSMQGKFATLADGVQRALKKMRPLDRFRIILFNDHARELTQGYVNATPDRVRHYSDQISRIDASGSTNLYAGLRDGLKAMDADRTSAIILVTDGVANVGETRQRHFLNLLSKKDVRLFTFIMGNSANQPLLETLTRASNGFAQTVSNSDDIVGQILLASSKVTHQALHGVQLKIKGVKTADLTPSQIGSLYRGQQLVLFGHYWGDGMADITLTGQISGTNRDYRTRINFPAHSGANPELERLWAYATIEEMTQEIATFGEEADLKQAITDLGIEYGLVTDYTAMLVLRDEVFSARGIERNNQARLAIEKAAQQQRATQATATHRVDSQQPMFHSARPSLGGSSGGGSTGGWTLLALLGLWLVSKRQTAKEN